MSDETIFCDICGVAQKSVRGLAIHKGRMHPDAPISEQIADAEFDQPVSTNPVQVIPKVDAIISPVLAQSTEDDMEEPVNDDEMYPSAMDFPKVDPSILGIREVLIGSLVKLTNGATTWRIENGQAILATLAEPIPCTVKHRYLSNEVWTLYLEANGAKDLFLLCLEQDVLNGCHMLGRLGAPVEALPKEMPSVGIHEETKAVETTVEAFVAEEVTCHKFAQELDEIISDVRAAKIAELANERIAQERLAKSLAENDGRIVREVRNFTTPDSLQYSASVLSEFVGEIIEEKAEERAEEKHPARSPEDQAIVDKFENEMKQDMYDESTAPKLARRLATELLFHWALEAQQGSQKEQLRLICRGARVSNGLHQVEIGFTTELERYVGEVLFDMWSFIHSNWTYAEPKTETKCDCGVSHGCSKDVSEAVKHNS